MDKPKKIKKLILKKLKKPTVVGEEKTPMKRLNEDYVKILSEIEFIKMKRGDFMSA